MANKIQLRRDTAANWNRVNPVLDDGEPGLNIDTNQIKYGDGSTAWQDLDYASGGGGLVDVNGVVEFPGNLLIGTLWADDPLPGGDKESVVWAKDDTEYLGLWWGGDQIYPDEFYGPVAGIMIGSNDDDNLTDDFTDYASPVGTKVTVAINDQNGDTLEWTFDRDGNLTIPGEIHSEIGIGDVTLQSNDGATQRNFVFNINGSILLPEVSGQGFGSFDATDNTVSMTLGDTVDFAQFSGMILVNCYGSGDASLWLCGSGSTPVRLGHSAGSGSGTMASNGPIGGYTFTATETAYHAFCAIRTRTGA